MTNNSEATADSYHLSQKNCSSAFFCHGVFKTRHFAVSAILRWNFKISLFFPFFSGNWLTANQLQCGTKKSFPTLQSAHTFTQPLFLLRVSIWSMKQSRTAETQEKGTRLLVGGSINLDLAEFRRESKERFDEAATPFSSFCARWTGAERPCCAGRGRKTKKKKAVQFCNIQKISATMNHPFLGMRLNFPQNWLKFVTWKHPSPGRHLKTAFKKSVKTPASISARGS